MELICLVGNHTLDESRISLRLQSFPYVAHMSKVVARVDSTCLTPALWLSQEFPKFEVNLGCCEVKPTRVIQGDIILGTITTRPRLPC